MARHPLFFVDLRHRSFEEELMDRADVDQGRLKRTIEDFDLLNRLFSASMALFRRHLLPTLLTDPTREWTILDFGSGGGDIDRAIVRLCRRRGLRVKITAVDVDPRLRPWAEDLCRGYPEITPVTASVFALPPGDRYDFVVSNHTLHHFSEAQVRQAVEVALDRGSRGILLNDLRRSFWAYVGYTIFTGALMRRSLVFYDGRLSIRRGFTVDELRATLAGLPVVVGTTAPARVYLTRA